MTPKDLDYAKKLLASIEARKKNLQEIKELQTEFANAKTDNDAFFGVSGKNSRYLGLLDYTAKKHIKVFLDYIIKLRTKQLEQLEKEFAEL